MAELSSGQKVQRRLLENITLMRAICEIPNPPKENELSDRYESRRKLPLDREKQLVDSFAFIAATTDDMLRVMATCVEETSEGMTIRLASNTGDLSHIIQGFNSIAQILKEASSQGRSISSLHLYETLFRQIVILDEARILSRLRSKHAVKTGRRKDKPQLLNLLAKTLDSICTQGYGNKAKHPITTLHLRSKQLAKKFADFEAARDAAHESSRPHSASTDLLIEVLISLREFDVESLRTTLELSRFIEPSLRTSLPMMVSKVGRYYEIAKDLIDAARGSQSANLGNISVQAIHQPQLDMTAVLNHPAGFQETLQRVTRSSHPYRARGYNPARISLAESFFATRVSGSNAQWKVHAEIQILLFYEQNPDLLRPRLIGSSKSACYLCDLFIHQHQVFQVSRSHGRLYDRWVLPRQVLDPSPDNFYLRSVVDSFNATLENKIVDILNENREPLTHPAESLLPFRQPWSRNATRSSIQTQRSVQTLKNDHMSQSHILLASQHDTSTFSPPITESSNKCIDGTQEIPVVIGETDSRRRPSSIVSRVLSRGESSAQKLTHKDDVFIVYTPFGNIHVSWDSLFSDLTSIALDRACWAQVSWLTEPYESSSVVDACTLASDCGYIVDDGAALSSKALALQISGNIFLIKYSCEDPEVTTTLKSPYE